MQNDAQKPVEDSATEVKKKGKWAFKKATSAVKKSHRGVLIQKGDTLWGLSRKYNVSRYAFRCMQRMNNASSVSMESDWRTFSAKAPGELAMKSSMQNGWYWKNVGWPLGQAC